MRPLDLRRLFQRRVQLRLTDDRHARRLLCRQHGIDAVFVQAAEHRVQIDHARVHERVGILFLIALRAKRGLSRAAHPLKTLFAVHRGFLFLLLLRRHAGRAGRVLHRVL